MSVRINGREVFNNTDINNPDIDGGTIDNTTIGGTTPAPGAFTTLKQTTGAKANLTAENQLSWDGAIYLGVGDKIQLTIAGGAADASTVCNIIAQYRAVVSGGSLTS